MIWTFLNLGKIRNLMTPPPLDIIWEKFEIGKILNFWNLPSEKKNKLKTLEIAKKNHFKTDLTLGSMLPQYMALSVS